MKQSATQRIQVGLVGLVIVLVFVTLANMALERANVDQVQVTAPAPMPEDAASQPKEPTAGEPLAELGVTPVAKEEPTLQGAPDAGSANVKPASNKPQ